MQVGDARTAATAVIWVVGHRKKANPLSQMAVGTDLPVEIIDDGDSQCSGARLDPVLAQLVAVSVVDGLDGVAQVVEHAGEGLERPALTAHFFPHAAVVLEGTEGDESVVAGATTEYLGSRVSDVAVP
jgi:hypothetical protein